MDQSSFVTQNIMVTESLQRIRVSGCSIDIDWQSASVRVRGSPAFLFPRISLEYGVLDRHCSELGYSLSRRFDQPELLNDEGQLIQRGELFVDDWDIGIPVSRLESWHDAQMIEDIALIDSCQWILLQWGHRAPEYFGNMLHEVPALMVFMTAPWLFGSCVAGSQSERMTSQLINQPWRKVIRELDVPLDLHLLKKLRPEVINKRDINDIAVLLRNDQFARFVWSCSAVDRSIMEILRILKFFDFQSIRVLLHLPLQQRKLMAEQICEVAEMTVFKDVLRVIKRGPRSVEDWESLCSLAHRIDSVGLGW